MTKTLIDIPDELLGEAMELLGTRTKADSLCGRRWPRRFADVVRLQSSGPGGSTSSS